MSNTKVATYDIIIEPSGKHIGAKAGQTLLDAAIRAGLQVPYGCRHGSCGACKALVLEGEYELMDRASEYSLLGFERDEGYVLMCSTIPEGDLVVEIEEEEEEGIIFLPVADFEAEIEVNQPLTHDIHLVQLRLRNLADLPYRSGQYVEFDIPGLEETRAYSMANQYIEGNSIQFHIKRVPGGVGSNYLCDLPVGSIVTGSGPYGKMQLRNRQKDLIFIAGGSGMAPIKALIEELFSEEFNHEAWFFYGVRTTADLYYLQEWQNLAEQHPNFHFIPALSAEPDDIADWTGERGFIADVLASKILNLNDTDAYLCGPPIMIETALQVLYKRGLRSSNITYDEF